MKLGWDSKQGTDRNPQLMSIIYFLKVYDFYLRFIKGAMRSLKEPAKLEEVEKDNKWINVMHK